MIIGGGMAVAHGREKEQRRILPFFITTASGFRFPLWLQVVTFIIILAIMLGSIAVIGLFSQNNAGPARLNPMVIQGLRMKGKLPSVGMGAGNIGTVNQRTMMMNRRKKRGNMRNVSQMRDLDSSAANLNYGERY